MCLKINHRCHDNIILLNFSIKSLAIDIITINALSVRNSPELRIQLIPFNFVSIPILAIYERSRIFDHRSIESLPWPRNCDSKAIWYRWVQSNKNRQHDCPSNEVCRVLLEDVRLSRSTDRIPLPSFHESSFARGWLLPPKSLRTAHLSFSWLCSTIPLCPEIPKIPGWRKLLLEAGKYSIRSGT